MVRCCFSEEPMTKMVVAYDVDKNGDRTATDRQIDEVWKFERTFEGQELPQSTFFGEPRAAWGTTANSVKEALLKELPGVTRIAVFLYEDEADFSASARPFDQLLERDLEWKAKR